MWIYCNFSRNILPKKYQNWNVANKGAGLDKTPSKTYRTFCHCHKKRIVYLFFMVKTNKLMNNFVTFTNGYYISQYLDKEISSYGIKNALNWFILYLTEHNHVKWECLLHKYYQKCDAAVKSWSFSFLNTELSKFLCINNFCWWYHRHS